MGAMTASAQAYNTTDRPVVVDAAGHRLDGKAHGKVDPDTAEVRAAVLSGALVVSDHVADKVEAAAAADDDAAAPAPAPPTQKGSRR